MKRIARLLQTLVLSFALAGAAVAATPTERVDINTADTATLDRVLLNIGPSKAQAIVDYRKAHGPFRSIDQLALVKGIGLKTIEKNRDRIVLGAARPAARAAAGRVPARAALQR
ncbi:ComEA family DNA-binding protein [Lysobacter sp. N42]|jgi:competence protein ComEA|uniref:ComEA family DNA-binding protein n=1 Tax=Lysobacter sp. N42 TaxID=2545719 RepID=UPI0010492D87|nr:ComEA family DNA-binding protein [Lysobacter sp. N42]TCZ88597.1 ComEA family DNA-binding protein [Lysobacter sp. N42]